MKRMRSKWAVLTAGLILLSAVAAGSAFGAEPVKGKVMIYSSIYLHIIEQLKPVLKKTFPDLDVQWFYGGSEKVIAKLVAEFDQGSTMADLIMIADPAYYNTLKRDGRLLQYKSPNAKYVLPAWIDKDGYLLRRADQRHRHRLQQESRGGQGPPQDLVGSGGPQVEGQGGHAQPASVRDGLCRYGGVGALAEARLAFLRGPPEKPDLLRARQRRRGDEALSAASSPWRCCSRRMF